MDPILVVSPHLDDAVLSAGQFLGGWPGAHVLTVFTGQPDVPMVTGFDARSGFTDSTHAMRTRRGEDERALAVLVAHPVHAGFLDHQYRIGLGAPVDKITQVIRSAAVAIGATRIVAPLGIAHADHVLVSQAALKAADRVEVPMWLYEDLPNRVLEPHLVHARIAEIEAVTGPLTYQFIGTSPLDLKEKAVGCYLSQAWALDRHACLCPERFWEVPL